MAENQTAQEHWMPMNYAARELGVQLSKLSAMAFNGKIEVRRDRRDARKRLVNLDEIKRVLGIEE